MPRILQLPCGELSAAYRAGRSTIALAQHYGCSPTTIAKYLRACGVAIRRARFAAVTIDAGLLRHAYFDERLPIAQIALRFGVSSSTIGNRRRALGLPTRPRQRAP